MPSEEGRFMENAGHPGGRLLRRADGAGARKLPDLGSENEPLSRLLRGLGHREARRGAGTSTNMNANEVLLKTRTPQDLQHLYEY
jgi:hypothetical protein